MLLHGEKIDLRPLKVDEIGEFYEWVTREPYWYGRYGDPIPTFEGFMSEWPIYYFDGSRPEKGRCFMILLKGEKIGEVNYHEIDSENGSAELDIILLKDFRGMGYGPDALKTLTDYLFAKMGAMKCIIEPIVLNERAVKAYEKTGFKLIEVITGDNFEMAHMEMLRVRP